MTKFYIYLSLDIPQASEKDKDFFCLLHACNYLTFDLSFSIKDLSKVMRNREKMFRSIPWIVNWDKFFAANPTISLPTMAEFYFPPEFIESFLANELLCYIPDTLVYYTNPTVDITLITMFHHIVMRENYSYDFQKQCFVLKKRLIPISLQQLSPSKMILTEKKWKSIQSSQWKCAI